MRHKVAILALLLLFLAGPAAAQSKNIAVTNVTFRFAAETDTDLGLSRPIRVPLERQRTFRLVETLSTAFASPFTTVRPAFLSVEWHLGRECMRAEHAH